MIKQFEINKTYSHNFIGDSDLYFFFKITKRTKKSVWIENTKRQEPIQRKVIRLHEDVEYISPMGNYSMSPILRANDEVKINY